MKFFRSVMPMFVVGFLVVAIVVAGFYFTQNPAETVAATGISEKSADLSATDDLKPDFAAATTNSTPKATMVDDVAESESSTKTSTDPALTQISPDALVFDANPNGNRGTAAEREEPVTAGKENQFYRPNGFDPNEPANISGENFREFLRQKNALNRAEALALATQLGWDVRGETEDGKVFELAGVDEDGNPVYFGTLNDNARISTAVTLMQDIAPYNAEGSVNGDGMRAGVWDAGAIRRTHREFGSRVFVMDGSTNSDNHATHVGGTVGASGVTARAKGMAPMVRLNSYNWTSDTSEMSAAGANTATLGSRLPVSNHSYGFISGWYGNRWYGKPGAREDEGFGQYGGTSRDVDQVAVNNPFYLPFIAAGNDRSDNAPANGAQYQYLNSSNQFVTGTYNSSTGPFSDGYDNGGFDTIGSGLSTAKNVVTIGAANDAVSNAQRNPSRSTITSFSGWGPVDDGRIKPDLVANGAGLYSPTAGSDSAYSSYSGTSMASPNATGTALLLQQLYSRKFGGEIMRGATLKALMVHSADDIGRPGPDYVNGWGLINAKTASDAILAHQSAPASFTMVEGQLSGSNSTDTYDVTWDGSSPLRATIVWTDPAHGSIGGLDTATSALVNDLDLRMLKGGGTTSPFRLNRNNPAANATRGDNTVDNVEQVLVSSPSAGVHTVRVSHKGSLTGGSQRYSLIITGQTSSTTSPALTVAPTTLTTSVDAGDTAASQTFTVQNTGQGTLSYNISDNVAWLAVSPATGTSTGEADTISVFYNTAGLAAGVYNGAINVSSPNGGTRSIAVRLTVAAPSIPLNDAVDLPGTTLTTVGTPWTGQMDVTSDGVDAGQSGNIGDNGESGFSMRVTGPGNILFGWKVDSEQNYDFLRFDIDGAEQSRISGSTNWATPQYSVPAGAHTLRWRFTKDQSVSTGVDAGYVDEIVYSQTTPEIQVAPDRLSSVTYAGSNAAAQNFSVRNSGSGALSYTIVDDANWLTVSPASGSSTGENDAITVNYATEGLAAGQYTAVITVRGSGGAAQKMIPVALTVNQTTPTTSFSDATDFNGYSWTLGGTSPWVGQAAINHDGTDAGQSGDVNDNQNSTATTSVTGPGALSFWWKVDSEAGYDFLRFKLDGNAISSIAGNRDWARVTQAIPAGNHTLTWAYEKDLSVSTGSDAGWLDEVTFTPEAAPALETTPGRLTFSLLQNASSNRSVSVRNTGGGTLSYSVTAAASWLTASPAGGTSTGETDTIQITANASGLAAGNYAGSVVVTGGGRSTNIPVSLAVTETPTSSPIDPQIGSPYNQDFSSGQLPTEAQGWEFNSTNEGRLRVVNGVLEMDDYQAGSAYSLNEAILHADLAGKSGVTLSFRHREFSDENDTMPASFSGSVNAEGVAVSVNGTDWFLATQLTNSGRYWRTITVNLDQAIAAAGISYTSDFQIKFQQYDNYPQTSDGASFDNFSLALGNTGPSDDHGNSLSSATPFPLGSSQAGVIEEGADLDFFRVDLPAAAILTLYSSGSLDTVANLLNASGTNLAQNDDGGSGRNFLINRNVEAGTYYLRVRSYGSLTGSYTARVAVNDVTNSRPSRPGTDATPPSLTGDNPFDGDAAPRLKPFAGAITRTLGSGTEQFEGQISLKFSRRTANFFTAKIAYQGRGYSLRGEFDESTGVFSGQATRRRTAPLDLSLTMNAVNGALGYAISGTLTDAEGTESDLRLREAFADNGVPGRYTFLIPADDDSPDFEPGGDGYGALVVKSNGKFSLSGRLGDGASFRETGLVIDGGEFYIYRTLYGRGLMGWVGGELLFRDVAGISDFDGTLQWKKTPNSRHKRYPDGFNIERDLIGSTFTAPVRGEHVISTLDAGPTNASLTLDGTGIVPPIGTLEIEVSASDRLKKTGDTRMSGSINRRSGIVKGSVVRSSLKLKNLFGGAVLQKQNIAGGIVYSTNSTGFILLEESAPILTD
ncbi:MAG: BACON domain-containing protein [Verrucomicrobiales bacterium]